MRQQPCDTSLPPSRLCRLLIIAFALKLTVLGMLIFEPSMPQDEAEGSASAIDAITSLFSGESGRGVAMAATPEGAAAPPALSPTNQNPRQNFGDLPLNPGAGEAVDNNRVLPSIGARPAGNAAQAPAQSGATGLTAGQEIIGEAAALAGEGTTLASPARQEDLARKEQDLRALEAELQGRLEKMKQLEHRLATMIKDAEDTNDAKFRHLVDVLSNMKSKQAAAVLETLDKKIAVKVLSKMRGRQAGEILTFVRPEIAAHLTESLARMQLPLE